MKPVPVSSQLTHDAQNVHHSLQAQLMTAYSCGYEAARATNPSTTKP